MLLCKNTVDLTHNLDFYICIVVYTCDSSPCNNGGTCWAAGDDYVCDCPHPHGGKDCEGELSLYFTVLDSKTTKITCTLYCIAFILGILICFPLYSRPVAMKHY